MTNKAGLSPNNSNSASIKTKMNTKGLSKTIKNSVHSSLNSNLRDADNMSIRIERQINPPMDEIIAPRRNFNEGSGMYNSAQVLQKKKP